MELNLLNCAYWSNVAIQSRICLPLLMLGRHEEYKTRPKTCMILVDSLGMHLVGGS